MAARCESQLGSSATDHSSGLVLEKGNNGYSYSLRDYSMPHRVTERYAREFGCSAGRTTRKGSRRWLPSP